jgi:Putative transposase
MPKALRPFFRDDRRLSAEVSRMIYRIITEFYIEVAGELLTSLIVAHQTFGDQQRWNPHYHCLVLDGGFDEAGAFNSSDAAELKCSPFLPASSAGIATIR